MVFENPTLSFLGSLTPSEALSRNLSAALAKGWTSGSEEPITPERGVAVTFLG
jgi:hypothetical protein